MTPPLAFRQSSSPRDVRIRWLFVLACALFLMLPVTAPANQAAKASEDAELEAAVQRVARELRCLVCQNETIAASHADLAVDLRARIREQLQAGRSQRQILDHMVERYGDFVLYRPPWAAKTWLLWAGPFLLLVVGLVALWRHARRSEPAQDDLPSTERLQQAHALLARRWESR